MNPLHLHLLALLAVLTSSCSVVPENAITLERYTELTNAPKLAAHRLRVSAVLIDSKGQMTPLPAFTVRPGQQATVGNSRSVVYPTRFHLPHLVPNQEGNFPVTPSNAIASTHRNTGEHLTLAARTRGAFVELSGSLVIETLSAGGKQGPEAEALICARQKECPSCLSDLFGSRAAGEAVSPICDSKRRLLYTNNKVTLPQFKTVESLIYVCGLPGIEHKVHLKEGNYDLVVRCEPVPSGSRSKAK